MALWHRTKKPLQDRPEEVVSARFCSNLGVIRLQREHNWNLEPEHKAVICAAWQQVAKDHQSKWIMWFRTFTYWCFAQRSYSGPTRSCAASNFHKLHCFGVCYPTSGRCVHLPKCWWFTKSAHDSCCCWYGCYNAAVMAHNSKHDQHTWSLVSFGPLYSNVLWRQNDLRIIWKLLRNK